MSGSPIIADDGSAIGLVSVSGDDRRRYAYCTGLQLCRNLPTCPGSTDTKPGNLPLITSVSAARIAPYPGWAERAVVSSAQFPRGVPTNDDSFALDHKGSEHR